MRLLFIEILTSIIIKNLENQLNLINKRSMGNDNDYEICHVERGVYIMGVQILQQEGKLQVVVI